ncbi:MAG: glycosyl hydrolase [Deltaproteobacteria bacterium]|nr:glycosyl hydrolase [Deltaproteobacteria bacterium]
MNRIIIPLMLFLISMCPGAGYAGKLTVSDPLDSPAMPVRVPARCVLLDIAQAGARLVAVGERGLIIISDDRGGSWRQVNVPTRVSLTCVKFLTSTSGWAVGHSGIVLQTEDGGGTWTRRLDGITAAKLALEAVKAGTAPAGPDDKEAKKRLEAARLLVEDGPDKPFLDLYFENAQTGFVVGAYGLIFRTGDGGKTWQPWMDHIENAKGSHLYAIRAVGNHLYISGEQGLFLRSTDHGQNFTKIKAPYGGTFFTMAALRSDVIVLAGLRGNLFRTEDRGKSFTQVQVPVPVSLSASTVLPDGTLILANQAGYLLASRDGGQTFNLLDVPAMPPVAAMTAPGDGATLVTVGVGGVISVRLPGAAPKARSGGAQ